MLLTFEQVPAHRNGTAVRLSGGEARPKVKEPMAVSAGRSAGRRYGRLNQQADTAAEPNRRNLTGRAEPPPRVPPVHSVQPQVPAPPPPPPTHQTRVQGSILHVIPYEVTCLACTERPLLIARHPWATHRSTGAPADSAAGLGSGASGPIPSAAPQRAPPFTHQRPHGPRAARRDALWCARALPGA